MESQVNAHDEAMNASRKIDNPLLDSTHAAGSFSRGRARALPSPKYESMNAPHIIYYIPFEYDDGLSRKGPGMQTLKSKCNMGERLGTWKMNP